MKGISHRFLIRIVTHLVAMPLICCLPMGQGRAEEIRHADRPVVGLDAGNPPSGSTPSGSNVLIGQTPPPSPGTTDASVHGSLPTPDGEKPREGQSASDRVSPDRESGPTIVSRPRMSLTGEALETIAGGPESWASKEKLGGSLQTVLLLSVVSLAPAILLMTTCYVRIIVVLSLLRQAIGLQALPPTQVLTSISLFMTLLVMTPVWTRVYDEAIKPYSDPETDMSLAEAYDIGSLPVREFMANQITAAGNQADVVLFYRHAYPAGPTPSSFGDIPIRVLLPAFLISELKVAFLMGFCIYLPFLVVDLVVASVTMSMGMFMLPPAMISLPLKLLLFVLVNGWHLVVGMLLSSFSGG